MSSSLSQKRYGSVETSRLLEESLSVSYATEDIGSKTLEELHRQREKLEGAQENITNMKDISVLANQNINAIRAKAFRKKMYLWGIIILLFILNLAVLMRMLSNGGKIYASYSK